MGTKQRKPLRRHSISPPELPNETTAGTAFDAVLGAGEHYADVVLSNRSFSRQTAARVTIQRARFQNVEMAGANLKYLRLTDTRFDHCDLANMDCSQSTLDRIELLDCRVTGVKLVDSNVKNASFEDCKIDLAQFRVCGFKDCRFVNCNLREADFYDANLDGAVFSGCDLRGAQMFGASLKGTDFRGSQLAGLQVRVEDLQGAIIDSIQLLDLARDLARLIGLEVLEADDVVNNRTFL